MDSFAFPFLQFDFTEPVGFAAPCRFVDPVEIVVAWQREEVLPVLRRVQAAADKGLYAAGFVAYEAAPAFDSAMTTATPSDLPLVWFGLYTASSPIDEESVSKGAYSLGAWTSPVGDAQYCAEIAAIRESIAAGDVYQVNHTLRMRSAFSGDAFVWYRRLRAAQSAAFAAYLDLGRFHILSLSPELFFSIEPASGAPLQFSKACTNSDPIPDTQYPIPNTQSHTIRTRPMKGTHPRGRWTEEDLAFQERLRNSEKDRAENLMIVDLLRNDLGRIAQTGSVRVEELFRIERYPTLLQMTSTISARLQPGAGLMEIFGALFPCGSIIGAPKIAAMRRIANLEPEPRGVYCGAIGYVEPGGKAVFSVGIRTIVLDKETNVAQYGVGSGITWDSQPDAEAAENRLKAAVLSAPPPCPDLFETLRLHNGVFTREAGHLARLLASAAYFNIAVEPVCLTAALARLAEERLQGLWRARLMLAASGKVTAECLPLENPPDQPRSFALSPDPIDREDRRLYHKMADRSLYTARRARLPGVYDVLLQNREGELTEFTTGNLVLEIEGERFTPPLHCGLLPGVFRAELLQSGEIQERVLRGEHLAQAVRIWLINSLRGWVPMREHTPER